MLFIKIVNELLLMYEMPSENKTDNFRAMIIVLMNRIDLFL